MQVGNLVDRIQAARETADGAEIGAGRLSISQTELSGIYEAFGTTSGVMSSAALFVVESQLRMVSDGLNVSWIQKAMGRGTTKNAKLEIAQIDNLLAVLKEAQSAKPPLTAEQMYERFVARVSAALDG